MEDIQTIISNTEIFNLKRGTKVGIVLLNDINFEYPILTKLDTAISEDEINILAPMINSNVITLPQNSEYGIIFKTKRGILKNYISIKEHFFKGNIYCFKAKLLKKETILIQRRLNIRLDISIDIKFDSIKDTSNESLLKDTALSCMGLTQNISAGGIKFFSDTAFNINNLIKISIPLEEQNIVCIASILAVEHYDKDFKYCYRACFKNIKKQDKTYISSYIINKSTNK